MMPLALVTAVLVLVTWFPLSTYMRQEAQLNLTAAQISAIASQQRAIASQAQSISSKASATQLARQDYQLVAPGQSLIEVLPGNVTGTVSPSSGDPGLQPLVSPSSVSTLVGTSSTSSGHHLSASGFLSRLVRTLEFWR
jgi:Flp pilus assembly protein TadG